MSNGPAWMPMTAVALLAACGWQPPPVLSVEPSTPSTDPAIAAKTRGPPEESGELIPVADVKYGYFGRAPGAPAPGEQAPRFVLPTSSGSTFDLGQTLAAGKRVVLVFYRERG